MNSKVLSENVMLCVCCTNMFARSLSQIFQIWDGLFCTLTWCFSQDLKFPTKWVLSFMIKVIVNCVRRIKWCGVLRQNQNKNVQVVYDDIIWSSHVEILSINMLSTGTACWLAGKLFFLSCHSWVKRFNFDVLSAGTTKELFQVFLHLMSQ